MPAVQVRLVAEGPESERLERLLGEAFEVEGYPVTREETVPYSEVWSVDVLVFEAESEEGAAETVRDALGSDAFGAELTTTVLDLDANWIAMSEEIRHPVEAGRFFVHGSHDRHRRPPSGISIEIDAEMAFGTGHHATTWCCLMALDRLLKSQRFERPLDLGTGTGVLAIALARVLRVPVVATDIDRVAVDIAIRNAALNGVAADFRCIVADGMNADLLTREGPWDLVVANILANALDALAEVLAARTEAGGRIALSGILDGQEDELLLRYAPYFTNLRVSKREDWIRIDGVRRA